ncbi:MAG: hypothetical protein EHM36_06370, partial [Deltaproteobacteria bacterium]
GHGKTHVLRTPNPARGIGPAAAGAPPLQTVSLIVTYHPSQQNTQTGKLTRPMFHRVFEMARKGLED